MILQAHKVSKNHGHDIETMFRYQYFISTNKIRINEKFSMSELFGLFIQTHPELNICSIEDSNGELIAYCIGIAVDHGGFNISDGYQLNFSQDSEAFWDLLEDFVIGLAGRYLIVVHRGGNSRIYGDLSNSMACVYDPETKFIASSVLLCLERDIEENPIMPAEWATTGKRKYCFGHTHDRTVKRLAVNCYLDIDRSTEKRFWPRSEDFSESSEDQVDDIISDISIRISNIFGAITDNHKTSMPLTGGNDSRVLAACCHTHLGKVDNFHTHILNYPQAMDARVGGLIAAKLNVQHEIYDGRRLTAPPRAIRRRVGRYQAVTGYEVSVPKDITTDLYAYPPKNSVLLRGNVMEILRAQSWKGRTKAGGVNYNFGLKRCLFSGGADVREVIDAWMPQYKLWVDEFDGDVRENYIDMGYVEHNLLNYGNVLLGFHRCFFISPFNDRLLFRLCAKLPMHYKSSGLANKLLISRNCPELLDIPYGKEIMRQTG